LRFLLDENFPLALLRRLRESGYDAEHLIALGQRGLPDAAIRERLEHEADLVLLTQDSDFEELDFPCLGIMIVSHVAQGLAISDRVAIWMRAVETLASQPAAIRLLELWEPGVLVPVEVSRIEGVRIRMVRYREKTDD